MLTMKSESKLEKLLSSDWASKVAKAPASQNLSALSAKSVGGPTSARGLVAVERSP